jgi:hypothetical protein
MNKIWFLAIFLYIVPAVASEENIQGWKVVDAHEVAKRQEWCDNEGDAIVMNDLTRYIELKHVSRTHPLNDEKKAEQIQLKNRLVGDEVLSADEREDNGEDIMLLPRGVRLIGR